MGAIPPPPSSTNVTLTVTLSEASQVQYLEYTKSNNLLFLPKRAIYVISLWFGSKKHQVTNKNHLVYGHTEFPKGRVLITAAICQKFLQYLELFRLCIL